MTSIASLEQASGEWEDYSEKLIDTGEMLSSAGGVRIVNEDDGDGDRMSPNRSKGLQDFEALMGVAGGLLRTSTRPTGPTNRVCASNREFTLTESHDPRGLFMHTSIGLPLGV
jgi:hypothetical protein